jgi:type II secretory pathway component GspD/PulD (secretin)
MAQRSLVLRVVGFAALAVISWIGSVAFAQSVTVGGRTVDLNTLPAEVRAKIQSGEIKLPPGAVISGGPMPVAGNPNPGGATPAAGEVKEEKKAEGDKPADSGVATVKRENQSGQADPNELKAKLDQDNKVQFSFHGQPWADVLKWFAELAQCSLDWQELPAENLNLVTQRRYTLDETRDLLNRYLIARGFTMLHDGDVITVAKLDKIDPSLVPRVEPDDLEDHMPYEFVRVRFDLPAAMDPAKAVDDVKVLLNSTNPKVTPLLASRQIMVIDAVANLRDVRDLLYSQKLAESDDIRPELFQIRFRRADYIAQQIMIVLGMDPSTRKEPMELQVEQQRLQLFMQMQQQGKDVTSMLRKDGPPVFIAVDKRRNTISVNAPPKEMEIVKRVVDQFDVPSIGAEVTNEELTTKRYRTVSASPDAVVAALKEIAYLNPLTQLQSDTRSKTIFATATLADHETIKGMIDKLDGTGREIHVIYLSRRTPADQIAGTIQALMVGEKKEEPRRPYYYYYDYYGGNQNQQQDEGFRIQADVENNRLILMATEDEFAEVQKMLDELGVITSERGGRANTFRVLEARDPQETAELLKRLQEAWGGRNPLNIHVSPPAQPPVGETPAPNAQDQQPTEQQDDAPTDLTTERSIPRRTMWLAQFVEGTPAAGQTAEAEPAASAAQAESAPAEQPIAEATGQAPTATPGEASSPQTENPSATGAPPINLTVAPDGRIILNSQDAIALDQLEELLSEIAPPPRAYKMYRLQNADCIDVYYNLKDYFTEELAADESDTMFRLWNGFDDQQETATLGKRRKLRFIWDTATNSVLVQNASPAQIQTIDELVKIYDQPPAEDSIRQRKTEIIQIQYSSAQDIATAVKEVYRDLLSSKDKEFQTREGERGGPRRQEIYYRFPGMGDSKSKGTKMAFEGALSVGVDNISNTLIISAEEAILENIRLIVKQLDEEARPDTVVQVHRITGSLDSEELEQALSTALSQPWPGGKPQNAGGQNGRGGGRNGRGGWNGGGDRGRGRGDRGRNGN